MHHVGNCLVEFGRIVRVASDAHAARVGGFDPFLEFNEVIFVPSSDAVGNVNGKDTLSVDDTVICMACYLANVGEVLLIDGIVEDSVTLRLLSSCGDVGLRLSIVVFEDTQSDVDREEHKGTTHHGTACSLLSIPSSRGCLSLWLPIVGSLLLRRTSS